MIKYKTHTGKESGHKPWYWFTQVSRNNKVLLTSETYTRKQNMMKGLLSAADNRPYVIINQ